MLPFQYAIRNLIRDPIRFAQKVAGSCLVVILVLAAGAFNQGMDQLLRSSGAQENVIFLGAGSEESVERSEVHMQAEQQIAAGVRKIRQRMNVLSVSGEVHYMGMLSFDGGKSKQALLRGVTVQALEVHDEVRLIEGRFPGSGEVMIGRLTHVTLGMNAEDLTIGSVINFESERFEIVGVFDAPGTVLESEVWFKRSDLMTLTQRESLSCVVIKMDSKEEFKHADLFAKQRLDLELTAVRESDYYAQLSSFYAPIRWMTWLTALLIAAGAVFGGFNMLYAAFASRIKELAALQTIGFSRTAIFLSLVQESLLTTLIGTFLAVALSVLLLEGNTIYFSIGTFSLTFDPRLLLIGLLTGLGLGTIGAIPPSIRCLATSLPKALRS